MDKDLSYILQHLGDEPELYSNAVVPPIFQTSNFAFKSVKEFRERLSKEYEQPFYTRGVNPTVKILRDKIAAMEQTEDALVFSSGAAAIAASVLNCVKAGDHIVCIKKPYAWANYLMSVYLPRFGVETTFVDGRDTGEIENAIRDNTAVIYLESPNSITFELQDLAAVSKIARARNITTIIDNSHCTAIGQLPVQMGIDIVIYSASKYLNGHSDVVAGVVGSNAERIRSILSSEYMTLGAICSPFEAWLIMRGMRTMELRYDRSVETAEKVFQFLKNHPQVEKIFYPFDPDSAQYDLAKRQMKKAGGLVTITVKAESIKKAELFSDSLKYFHRAVSWGGYESLQFPVASLYQDEKDEQVLPWNMVRLYCGLESPELLIQDLQNAFEKLK